MTEDETRIVHACISQLLQEVAEDVPISVLKTACMDKGLEVDESVLLAHLVQMQVTYSDGCGLPQLMVNDDDQSFFLVPSPLEDMVYGVEAENHAYEEEGNADWMDEESKIRLLQRVYERPDLTDMLVSMSSRFGKRGEGRGGLNTLRMVNKRLFNLVKVKATMLTLHSRNIDDFIITSPDLTGGADNIGDQPHETSLMSTVPCLEGYERVEHIKIFCPYILSLSGCPTTLKTLEINVESIADLSLEPLSNCNLLETLQLSDASRIVNFSPLSMCTRIKKLCLLDAVFENIAFLSSMTQLEDLKLSQTHFQWREVPSIVDLSPLSHCKALKDLRLEGNAGIEDLSPLSHCKALKELRLQGNAGIEDLSPLSQCDQIERLFLWGLTHITSLRELSFLTNLKELCITDLPISDLSPLSNLDSLEDLWCRGIPLSTSVLPIASCRKLENLYCTEQAKDLVEVAKAGNVVIG